MLKKPIFDRFPVLFSGKCITLFHHFIVPNRNYNVGFNVQEKRLYKVMQTDLILFYVKLESYN